MTTKDLKNRSAYIIQAFGSTPLCKVPKKISIIDITETCIEYIESDGNKVLQTKEYLDRYFKILEELK